MSSHITISHGSDFFGQEQVPAQLLRELGQYVRDILPADDCPPLTRLLDDAGDTEHTLDPGQAGILANLLCRAAAHRRLKKAYADIAARLGRAAACAVADSEPWTWTASTESGRP